MVALTARHVAVEAVPSTNGFQPVLIGGTRAWIEAGRVYQYRNPNDAKLRCFVLAVRPRDKTTVFRIAP